jgi:hypothetical protein
MSFLYIGVIALAAALAAFLALRALRAGGGEVQVAPESFLLEEATVTEPIAPGMEGKAEIRKRGAGPLALRVRASDPAQAFARGSKVRVIDCREGCCFIESADEEHLVR